MSGQKGTANYRKLAVALAGGTLLAVPAFVQAAANMNGFAPLLPAGIGTYFNGEKQAGAVRAQLVSSQDLTVEETRLSEEQDKALRNSLRREPLNSTAIALLASAERTAGDQESFQDLVAASQNLQKRSRALNALRMQAAVDRQDLPAAIRALDLFLRTRPAERERIYPILFEYAKEPDSGPTFVELLSHEPDWAPGFFGAAAKSGENISFFGQLRLDMANRKVSNPNVDAALISRLAKSGEYDLAWAIYQLDAGDRASGSVSGNDRFVPFDWALSNDAQIIADLESEGSILIDAARGASGTAAKQVVRLEPGRWNMVGDLSIDGAGGHSLEIYLNCAGQGRSLVPLLVLDEGRPGEFSQPLVVSGRDCEYREIDLYVNGELSRSGRIFNLTGLQFRRSN